MLRDSKVVVLTVGSLAIWLEIVFRTEAPQTSTQEDVEGMEVADPLVADSTIEEREEEEEIELSMIMLNIVA